MHERSGSAVRFAGVPAAVILLAALSGRAAAAADPGAADTVVLVSIDGMRWDYPARARAGSLARMASGGARCGGLDPPFPSSTFPAHASLATGVFPDRHGIVNNEFMDRERGPFRRDDDASWLLAEPIWVTAERQGARTFVYHWVFSYAAWHGVAPTRRVPFSSETADGEKIDRIVEWLSLPESSRPRLILCYLHGPDAAGHAEGPDARAVVARVRRTDRLIGRLLRALEDRPRSALVVVSDHGMAPVSRVIRIRELLRAGEARRARPVSTGTVSNVYCPEAVSCEAAEAALRRVPGMTVHRREDLPEALRYRLASRTGDLVAIAPAGAYFVDGPDGRPEARGMHGDPPGRAEMRGIFYAWGAGVRQGGRCDVIRAVDVAPFVCRLLGLECPEGIDGRVPEGLIDREGERPASRPAPAPRPCPAPPRPPAPDSAPP